MIDHFGINCADLGASARFYDAVLGVLGHRRVMDVGVAIGYGTDSPDFWISGGDAASGPNREVHIAFTAPDADTVRRWSDEHLRDFLGFGQPDGEAGVWTEEGSWNRSPRAVVSE